MKYYVKTAYRFLDGKTVPVLINEGDHTVTNTISADFVELMRQDITARYFEVDYKANKKEVELFLYNFVDLNINLITSGLPENVEELKELAQAIADKIKKHANS
jgi:hypothetical protein